MAIVQYIVNKRKKNFPLSEDKMLVFGREEQCDFQILVDGQISREHFAIEKKDGQFQLIDLGARNGTYLNDRKLENEIAHLKDGDSIRAGEQIFTFYLKEPPQSTEEIFQDVEDAVDHGESYHSLLEDIVRKNKK